MRPVEVVLVDEWLDHPKNAVLFSLVPEAEARMQRDGIPRYVSYIDGKPKIMKMDWVLSEPVDPDDLEGESLERHIERMLAQIPPSEPRE